MTSLHIWKMSVTISKSGSPADTILQFIQNNAISHLFSLCLLTYYKLYFRYLLYTGK